MIRATTVRERARSTSAATPRDYTIPEGGLQTTGSWLLADG